MTGFIERIDDDLSAVEPIFGWTLQGPPRDLFEGSWNQTAVIKLMTQQQSDELSQELWVFLEIESLGILQRVQHDVSRDKVIQEFSSTVEKLGDQNEVCFPWGHNVNGLSTN